MSQNLTKKILCVMQLPPPFHGASLMNNHMINSEIIKSNFDLSIINLQFSRSIKELKKFSLLKAIKTLMYCFTIINRMIAYRPDLVYFTLSPVGFAFYRDSLYVFVLKLFKAKLVFHLHGKGIKEKARKSSLKKFLYKRTFNKSYVICISERLVDDIAIIYKSKPYIVPNGIQPNERKIDRAKGQTDISLPQILFLSNFKSDKGVLILVEALKLLKEEGHTFNARLVGAPSDIAIETLQGIISDSGLADCVNVVGPLFGEDKYDELQKADIFVLPTYNDAFPLVIIEAYQFALPVVSTFEGGVPDMVTDGETGFLVKTKDPRMMADKIAILLQDKNLRIEMGLHGYERYMANYTLSAYESRLNNTFHAILAN